MCGLAGLFGRRELSRPDAIVAMTRRVAHRGPDGEGWVAFGGEPLAEVAIDRGRARCVLGHRRLSILDLSEAGRQPMRRGDLWVVYNGEIYNYLELRRELQEIGHEFVSGSDTEVLLAAFAQWGSECFARFRGMWGAIVLDTRAEQVWFSRDRLGIKPLYRASTAEGLAVVSEIKQLRDAPGFSLRPDAATLGGYLQTGFEDRRSSFFQGVEPFAAGTVQCLDLRSGVLKPPVDFWHPERVQVAIRDPGAAAEALLPVFEESVRLHLRSDVPVGCALSGGLDSGSIAVAIADGGMLGAHPLRTFSATFPGYAVDEKPFIDRVVERVRAEAHEITPSADQFLAELDLFLDAHDEPVGSASQYAGFAVARLTREAGVPVTLNGQGGDEVLGGYWQTVLAGAASDLRGGHVLRVARSVLGCFLAGGSRELIRQGPAMARRFVHRRRPDAILKLRGPSEMRPSPAGIVLGMNESQRRLFELRELTLPRLLKWDDRNFMAFSVEGRYPFLDHRVVETCLTFASSALFWRGWTKEPLRRAFSGRLPIEVSRRREKVGFETPQSAWLSGPLRSALAATVDQRSALWEFADRDSVRRLEERVRVGTDRDASQALFRVMLADRWLRLFGTDA